MKVSICIPTYKQIIYLQKNLESILIQDYEDYEVIITDDTPDDSVKDFVQSYKIRFTDKLNYYKNIVSLGTPENWNEAISKAKGEYIKILHHDDWFTDKNSLSEFVKMLEENPQSDFGFSGAVAINIKYNKTWIHSATAKQIENLISNPAILFFGNFIGPPSSIICRRNKYIKYNKNMKWLVDLEFYIRCLTSNSAFIFNEKPLITSISNAAHSVTNVCENNKNIEIPEYIVLFKTIIKNNIWMLFDKSYLLFFNVLFDKYNISSVKDIRRSDYNESIPLSLILLLVTKKIKTLYKQLIHI